MPIDASYIFMVSMDVAADKEDLFNEIYDHEHVPNLLEVPGVLAVRRARSVPFALSVGGEIREIAAASPRYVAIYEITSPDVLRSEAWKGAVEAGRWPSEVRPFTTNRRHVLAQTI